MDVPRTHPSSENQISRQAFVNLIEIFMEMGERSELYKQ
jgi:hypothetical protein